LHPHIADHRRRLSNGRHSAERSVPFSSFLTGILVAVSVIPLSPRFAHDGKIRRIIVSFDKSGAVSLT
jgi:hypothetical protein